MIGDLDPPVGKLGGDSCTNSDGDNDESHHKPHWKHRKASKRALIIGFFEKNVSAGI